MGIKFKSPLALSAHRAIAHSDDAQTLEVTVVTKTAAHPEFGNGSTDGYAIDGVEGPYLEFTPGNTYKFDQSDSSNTGHPLAFYEDAAKTTSYTSGVTTVGTPGSAGAYTQIIPTVSTPPILYYQCTSHSLMGSYTKFGTGSQGDTYTFSASQDGNNVDLLLDAGSGTDSTVQLTAGTNITLTRNSASEVTIDAAGGSGGAADSALKILLTVKNVSGGSLGPGTLVRVAPTATPPSGNVLEVDVADNTSSSTMPAIGILTDTIADQAEGDCVAFGRVEGFSTSGYTEGDPIWVGTNGGFTGTKPTGTAQIQRVGQIIKVHATNGSIEVFGAGRSNDVPNIPQDQLWLGNSSGVATPIAHTVENISNVTVNSKQDGQSLVWDAANNYWKNATVSGGGGSGSGTSLSIERNVFTATANQTAFVISSAITSSSNTQVYIDGVYQSKDNYTTSGSTVTFNTGVPANSEVEVVHFISVLSKVYTDDFTGDGSTVNFTASNDVTDENVTQVYIDGVYQSKDNYSTSGTTITFSTAPPNGSAVEVVHFVPATYSSLNSNQFTGTGSQTNFTLTQAVDIDKSFVFIQGVYQEKSTYSISGTTLTFTTAPQNGYSVEVITVGASAFTDTLYVDRFNGNSSTVNYTLSTSPATVDAIDVYINGLYQQKNTYSVSGTILTFSQAPPNTSTIEVKTIGGLNTVAVDDTVYLDSFTGNGSTVDYTLSTTPADENAVDVYLNGIYQNKSNFTLSGAVLTFSTAPTNNTAIEIKSIGRLNNVLGNVVLTAGTGISITENSRNNFTISNTLIDYTVSYNTPTGQGLTYTTPSTSAGRAGSTYGPQTFTITDGSNTLSGTASVSGLPNGLTVDNQSYNNSNSGNILTITLGGVFPSADSLNTNLVISGLTSTAPPLVADYLVVAGGGGAAGDYGGGGGAGGLRTSYGSTSGGGASAESSLSLSTATNYTVTVGSGGSGSTGAAQRGGNGSNSVFSTITSIGGGSSGAEGNGNGLTGGSGGGGSYNGNGASGTANQGYGGGNGTIGSYYTSGGGGGAAEAGKAGNGTATGSNGGNGLSVSITGTAAYYAGGGGGGGGSTSNGQGPGAIGEGGLGGGGDSAGNTGDSGTANTGGGGGGGQGDAGTGGDGGSGVVILRYPNSYTITVGSGLSSTTSTDGVYYVTTFTGGTGNISFS